MPRAPRHPELPQALPLVAYPVAVLPRQHDTAAMSAPTSTLAHAVCGFMLAQVVCGATLAHSSLQLTTGISYPVQPCILGSQGAGISAAGSVQTDLQRIMHSTVQHARERAADKAHAGHSQGRSAAAIPSPQTHGQARCAQGYPPKLHPQPAGIHAPTPGVDMHGQHNLQAYCACARQPASTSCVRQPHGLCRRDRRILTTHPAMATERPERKEQPSTDAGGWAALQDIFASLVQLGMQAGCRAC